MKFLINNSFRAIKRGEFVKANKKAGEFVLDTKKIDDFAQATLMEIGIKNKVVLQFSSRKSETLKVLESGLLKLNLIEASEMSEENVLDQAQVAVVTQEQKVKNIIVAGIAADKSDDQMIVELINSGIPFKVAGKLFYKEMTEGGYRLSAAQMKATVQMTLESLEFVPEKFTDIEKMADALINGNEKFAIQPIKGLDSAEALKGIKAYLKGLGIEIPKKEKAPKVKGEKVAAIIQSIMDFMTKYPNADEAHMKGFLTSEGKHPDDATRKVNFYLPLLKYIQSTRTPVVEAAEEVSEAA